MKQIVHISHYSSSRFDQMLYYQHFTKLFYKYFEQRQKLNDIYFTRLSSALNVIPKEKSLVNEEYEWKMVGRRKV